MAVTLTVAELAVQLRVITSSSETIADGQASVLGRTLAAATAAVESYAPSAPAAIQEEAVIRLASRLYDVAGSEGRGGNPMILSGAAHLLSRHRARNVTTPSVTEVSR